MRKTEFDILKGLMIIAVVMGHAGVHLPGVDLAWVRMPAFFMISGYFTRELYGSMATLRRKAVRLLVPFLAYSVLMYILFRPEPVLKNVVRTLYGGRLDTLIYSYPWWFVHAMMMAIILFALLKKIKIGGGILALICYVLIHITPLWEALPVPLPWGLDTALGAVVYMYIGYRLKGYELRRRHLWLLLIPVLFVAANQYFGWEYRLNMKEIHFENVVLDLVVPVSFTFLFYVISLLLSKVKVVAQVFAHIGVCSLTIFYVHAAVIHFLREGSPWWAVLAGVVAGVAIEALWQTNRYTRTLFLGQLPRKAKSNSESTTPNDGKP